MEDVDPDVRMALLAELASLREHVDVVVMCCPDRYGASAQACLGVARDLAADGLAVVLQLMSNTATVLAAEPELATREEA